ncbi:hypothetical protein PCE1_000682 [Barthelona sp. PCE]
MTGRGPVLTIPRGDLFHCVYVLVSNSPLYARVSYIGYSVDPARRLRQHNGHLKSGGANFTKKYRPWEMVCFVYGFPDKTVALQFEWALQNPEASTKVPNEFSEEAKKSQSRYMVQNKLFILLNMLSVDPWKSWPLKLHFLSDSHLRYLSGATLPPDIMITVGDFLIKKKQDASSNELQVTEDDYYAVDDSKCIICQGPIDLSDPKTRFVQCSHTNCKCFGHVACFAMCMLRSENRYTDRVLGLIPSVGKCPACREMIKWSDMIEKMRSRQAKGDDITNEKIETAYNEIENLLNSSIDIVDYEPLVNIDTVMRKREEEGLILKIEERPISPIVVKELFNEKENNVMEDFNDIVSKTKLKKDLFSRLLNDLDSDEEVAVNDTVINLEDGKSGENAKDEVKNSKISFSVSSLDEIKSQTKVRRYDNFAWFDKNNSGTISSSDDDCFW